MFSNRTAWDLSESSLTAAIRQARVEGESLIDLTASNPTTCGFLYDSAAILGAFRELSSLIYDPDPRGIPSARDAVANYYGGHDAQVDPNQIMLTTSTSEAYSFLFRLLCDAGDEVLYAQPSYPLFDFLANLDDVVLQSYPLFYDFGWWIDLAELERRITPRARAILLVHPNNPTGHATSLRERHQLESLCARHNLALIVDEVFLDYPIAEPIPSFAAGEHPCLTFVVSGLSKVAALPQMKVGWLAAFGPGAAEALARLEIVADTFLSLSAPAQQALPTWLAGREAIQNQIMRRVRENLATVAAAEYLVHLPVAAGWSGVLRVPQSRACKRVAERLVEEANVIVHPGSFYGMYEEHWVVVSLLSNTEAFSKGIANFNQWCTPAELPPSYRHHPLH